MPDLERLTQDELEYRVRNDFLASRDTRITIRDRKLQYYQLYRAWRDDVAGGGQSEAATNGAGQRGPFNWSRLTIPIVFIVTENFVSRVSVEAPSFVVKAGNPQSVPHALAKQTRVNRFLSKANWRRIMVAALKDFCLMGDAFIKVTWDFDRQQPKLTRIPWDDFFFSAESDELETARVLYHRTWHDRDQVESLMEQKDADGKPLYTGLEDLMMASNWRDSEDETWQTRRMYSGQGPTQWATNEAAQVAMYEAHYADGTIVTFGGPNYSTIFRAVATPYVDEDGIPVRPFVSFANTFDPNSPYAIGDAEMVEDCQREAQTIIDQAVDQAARNINRPIIYNEDKISGAQIDASYGRPGGKAGIQGDPTAGVVMEAQPVELSRDVENVLNRIMQVSQMVSGITDEATGQQPQPDPGSDDTGATGAWLRYAERNRRVRYKLTLVADAMQGIGQRVMVADRCFNRRKFGGSRTKGVIHMPVDRGFQWDPEKDKGISMDPTGSVATIGPQSNADGMDFELHLDVSTLEAPFAQEQARRAGELSKSLLQPQFAPFVNARELASMQIEAAGFDPARLMLQPGQEGQPGVAAGQPGMPAPGGGPGQPGMGPAGPPMGGPSTGGMPDLGANGAGPGTQLHGPPERIGGPGPGGAPVPAGPPPAPAGTPIPVGAGAPNGGPPPGLPPGVELHGPPEPMPGGGGEPMASPAAPTGPDPGSEMGLPPELVAALKAGGPPPSAMPDLGDLGIPGLETPTPPAEAGGVEGTDPQSAPDVTPPGGQQVAIPGAEGQPTINITIPDGAIQVHVTVEQDKGKRVKTIVEDKDGKPIGLIDEPAGDD